MAEQNEPEAATDDSLNLVYMTDAHLEAYRRWLAGQHLEVIPLPVAMRMHEEWDEFFVGIADSHPDLNETRG
jgi:hypothetical protein